MPGYRNYNQKAGGRRHRVAGVIVGLTTLAAFAGALWAGFVRYPAPYHHRLGTSFTAIVWQVQEDGRLLLVPVKNRGHQFSCSLYGVVLPNGSAARLALQQAVLHQGVVVTIPGPEAQAKELYRIARERDGADLGELLVRSGAAYAALPGYRGVEAQAASEHLGLWRHMARPAGRKE